MPAQCTFHGFIASTANVIVGFILKLIYGVYYMFNFMLLHYLA
jgi:hypothetical protein